VKTRMQMKSLAAATLLAASPLSNAGGDAPPGSISIENRVKVLDNTGASRGQTQVASRIAASVINLAGSEANALALVLALHKGAPALLRYPGGNVTFTPPTKAMGWGSVKIALALAQAQLQQLGIAKVDASQLRAALNGGTVKRGDGHGVALSGVLALRAHGMSWAQITQDGGTRVSTVLSAMKQTQSKVAELPVKDDAVALGKP
jgi:hypothetical protein